MEKGAKAKAGLSLDNNDVACAICTYYTTPRQKMARDIPGITMKHVNFARVLTTGRGIHGKAEHVSMRRAYVAAAFDIAIRDPASTRIYSPPVNNCMRRAMQGNVGAQPTSAMDVA
ncbi:hypothetical protein G5I_05091 [Acromyrmex echinatior]|uniref:Uncharacterized protein n=1 Tax=Acromyrmex echinatior TaxID=103372 RepID=F4WHD1_ACREC|nr:hypothetical protein G5I_05091 [Acromyrmex echinatior]